MSHTRTLLKINKWKMYGINNQISRAKKFRRNQFYFAKKGQRMLATNFFCVFFYQMNLFCRRILFVACRLFQTHNKMLNVFNVFIVYYFCECENTSTKILNPFILL